MAERFSAMEVLVSGANPWRGRSVFVTGHTGFKGSWLTLWLRRLGAQVHGYALDPPTEPSLFAVCDIPSLLASDTRADLAELSCLSRALATASPEFIFHLAAQPLVRDSYRDPLATLRTNVIGTAHVLEAMRAVDSVRACVIVTTDKVYENLETSRAFQESDPLGGHDPYSASKAAAEIVTASYRSSFYTGGNQARIATARAGNVIGGGDWGSERLVPDCLRAFAAGKCVQLRYPQAIRPWQHVLEPLQGYIRLSERLYSSDGEDFARAWNFGPDRESDATVADVAQRVAALWSETARVEQVPSTKNPHEAALLHLDSSEARNQLDWRPRWTLDEALTHAVAWHRSWLAGEDMQRLSIKQIADYEAAIPA